jgi:hypothetical protein
MTFLVDCPRIMFCRHVTQLLAIGVACDDARDVRLVEYNGGLKIGPQPVGSSS